MAQSKLTRFRAYQLGNEGSSFSYFDGGRFFLIEGRLNDVNDRTLDQELAICSRLSGKSVRIDVLHITSWDEDHCAPGELRRMLNKYRPLQIETPGYSPSTDCGRQSARIIQEYQHNCTQTQQTVAVIEVSPKFISGLSNGEPNAYNNIIFHPNEIFESSNNNSTIKLFRSGSFSVLSLGDVESEDISIAIANSSLAAEVDVMILAHHGAHNGFTSRNLLRSLVPTVAICSSNYDNQYEHPKPEITNLLFEHGIDLYTTKTGDCIVRSIYDHSGGYQVINLRADSSEISSTKTFKSKRL